MQSEKSIRDEATSKQTLEDVEENEKSSAKTSDDGKLPSPDGAFDETSEKKQADPM